MLRVPEKETARTACSQRPISNGSKKSSPASRQPQERVVVDIVRRRERQALHFVRPPRVSAAGPEHASPLF